jgi:tetratricopeptide (TPR) repeat protein/DNA-binding CsgD family transcriptional regulator
VNRLLLFLVIACLSTAVRAQSEPSERERRAELETQLKSATGSDRIPILQALSDLIVEDRDSTALEYAKEALELAEDLQDPNQLVAALNAHAHALSKLGNHPEALKDLDRAEAYFMQGIRDEVKARTYWRYGDAHHQAANYDLARFYYEKAKGIAESLAESELQADITADLAVNYRFQGEFDQATERYFDALRYYETVNDSQPIMKMLTEIGIVRYIRGETDQALEAFLANRDYHERRQDSIEMGFANTLLGLGYYKKKDYDQSITYSNRSIEIRQAIGDVPGLGESYNNLALAYMGQKDWEMAGVTLQRALDYLQRGNDLRQIPVIISNIADTRRMMGRMDEALEYYEQALEEARASGLRTSIASSLKKICNLYRARGDYKAAYAYQLRYSALKDSIFNEEKAKVISNLNLQYDTEKKEQEISMLKAEQEAARRQKLFLGIVLALVVIISILVLILQRQRIRKNKMLHEKEKQIMRAREQLTDAELRNTRNELEHNKLMLANYMENILRKNALLEQLESQISELNLPGDEEEREREQNIRKLLNMKILTNEDWQEFKRHFDQVHRGLLHRLQEQYPDLTRGENRLFILLKLKLNSKEISNILGVSPESVKKSRYRLRKKLALEAGFSLGEFVDNFK